MKQTVENYNIIHPLKKTENIARGYSVSPKGLIAHIFEDNSAPIEMLDIGFGAGDLGKFIKEQSPISHWNIDGVDGFEPNCNNQELFEQTIYRNVWHGLAQDIPSEQFKNYHLICLLDVIEHLDVESAKSLLKYILSSMNDHAYLFISTPLWFLPQDSIQEGDLEEHLIGVPASSMMSLMPKLYAVDGPLVGGFVLGKLSLDYIDFFQPTANKNFSYEQGLNILKIMNCEYNPGRYVKIW